MKLHRLILALCFLTCSLSTRHEEHDTHKIDEHEYAKIISDFTIIVSCIANISENAQMKVHVRSLNLNSKKNISENFAYLCAIVDQILKDFKTVCSLHDYKKIEKFIVCALQTQQLTSKQLLSMQRHNRAQIKEMIPLIKHIPDSHCLQQSLQELYHALHEVKKQITTLDKISSIKAWYIYVTMLFLQVTLVQGMKGIQAGTNHAVEQQVVMHQLTCIVERFKRRILSDFYL